MLSLFSLLFSASAMMPPLLLRQLRYVTPLFFAMLPVAVFLIFTISPLHCFATPFADALTPPIANACPLFAADFHAVDA